MSGKNKKLKFPGGFLWGAATSAYQVEGGITKNDWAETFPANKAAGHYQLFEKDFDLALKLNHNAHRLSLEWSRIEPEPNHFNQKEIDHYREVLTALKERGMKTFLTLFHFTSPSWMSWADSKSPFYFSRFTKLALKEYRDLVDFWITINEPVIYAPLSYLTGKWPPQKKNPFLFLKVLKNMIRAHKKAYKVLHQKQEKVGIAKNNAWFNPEGCPLLKALFIPAGWFNNHFFLERIKDQLDFIGLNYYFAKGGKKKNKLVSDIGWKIDPEGLYHVLCELKRYNLPIYITENGLADEKDELREDFIKRHLYWAHKAMEEGVDLKGYLHWSLLDNFEWAEGFSPRFGLIKVDYETLEREIRSSARSYADIAKTNTLKICG